MILVHRHTFPVRDVIEMLLEASPEADRWQMRVEGDELVIDIVGPAETSVFEQDAPANFSRHATEAEPATMEAPASNETAKSYVAPETATEAPEQPQEGPRDRTVVETPPIAPADAPAPEEPELKGGRLARDASMLCQDKTFRLWIDADDADQARGIVLRHCGVESRRLLDHEEDAARKWREIDRLYAAWLAGDDEAQLPQLGENVP